MVQNITDAVATNATETTLTISYDINLTTIISIISVIIILLGFLYKYGQQLGELKGVKELIDAKLKVIDEKYNTSEKIQTLVLKVQAVELKVQAVESKVQAVELKVQAVESKVQAVELKVQDKISRDDFNAHIYEIVNNLSAMGEEIETLKKQNEDLKKELEQHKNWHSKQGRAYE